MHLITIPRKAPLYLLVLLIVLNAVFYAIDIPGNRKEPVQTVQKVYAQETENDILPVIVSKEPIDQVYIPDCIHDVSRLTTSSLSDEEIDLIALVTMAEAEGEDELGKRYVIDAILHRVECDHDYLPDTVYDVIYQKNAFEPVWNGRMDRCYVMDDIRELVLEEIENRTNYDVVYFTAGRYNEYGTPLFKHGNHYFSGH